MWFRIVKIVAAAAVQLGLVDKLKGWLKKRIEKQLEKSDQKASAALEVAMDHGIEVEDLVVGKPK